MSYERTQHAIHLPGSTQRGAAFIVMLVILILGVAAVMVNSLSSAGARIERDVKTTEVLAQARDALISDASVNSDYGPGNMYCPDTNDNGESDAGGTDDCPQYIGRLPWKTLGLPDLRDASGERLWYTLSRNVRRYDSVRPLNSDTAGTYTASTLSVTGSSSESNLLAIVFSPGDNVSGQRRSDNTAACTTTGTSIKENRCAANYLEGSNDDLSDDTTQNLNYQNANTAALLNDRLVTITRDQLMERTEKRVGGEIGNILENYYSAWGAFPFPAAFADPSTSTFTGQVGNYEGLLPVGDNIQPTWAGIPTVQFPSGGGSSDPCELRVGVVPNSRWRCENITLSAGKTIRITGTLNDVGRGLWRPHNVNNICEVRAKDSGGNNILASEELVSVSVTGTLNPDGSATIVFQAQGKTGGSNLDRIELRDISDFTTDIRNYSTYDCNPKLNALDTDYNPTHSSPVIPKWLLNDANYGFDGAAYGNQWHKLTYYAVADEYAPGGDHSCSPTPCLTVSGQNGGNNVKAVVVMTGRTLTGQTRTATTALCPATGTNIATAACISNYLEGGNPTAGDRSFENQTRSATFNDQVIVISP